VSLAVTSAANNPVSSPGPPSYTPGGEKSYFARRGPNSSAPGHSVDISPKTHTTSLSPPLNSPTYMDQAVLANQESLASYALELVSEYLTREKREHTLKNKWAKSGRDQLSKDLAEIESSLCLSGRNTASSYAPTLLPIFLLLRRDFTLPPSALPSSVTDPYMDILPAPPDPDDVPFREPTVQSTTARLYVNPRLDDAAALDVMEELVENEKEQVEAAGGTKDQAVLWITELIKEVEQRVNDFNLPHVHFTDSSQFPDGSYARVFPIVKDRIGNPPARSQQLSPSPAPETSARKKNALHRRVQSTAAPHAVRPQPTVLVVPSEGIPPQEHKRSISMPMRGSTYDESDPDSSEDEATGPALQSEPILTTKAQLIPLDVGDSKNDHKARSSERNSGGWWDVVSAVENEAPAPWHVKPISTARKRTSSSAAAPSLGLPPGAEPAQLPDFQLSHIQISQLDSGPSTPPRQPPLRSSPGRRVNTMGDSLARDSPAHIENGQRQRSPGLIGPESDHVQLERQSRPPPIPLNISRPSFPSAQSSSSPSFVSSALPSTTSPVNTSVVAPVKSKLGGLGRSMSIAMHRSKKEERERDKENEKGREKILGGKKVMNNPGKWNRDMVANIMGPPAERK